MIAPIAAMPVANVTVPTPAFHRGDLGLERGRRRIALAAVGVAGGASLEHGGELARVAIAVGDRKMQRLVQRAVLDRRVAVGMQDGGREAALGASLSMIRLPCGRCQNKKPVGHPPDGFRVLPHVSLGGANLALAEFITRPQAEASNRRKLKATAFASPAVKSPHWRWHD